MTTPNPTPLVYRRIESDADLAAYARVLAHSFGRQESESAVWVSKCDPSFIRVMSRGDEILAGVILFEKGQFWGGRSVPMVGVGAVGVMPHARGGTLASRLMVELLCEARQRGFALSSLYPATQKLYRAVGYEQSGHRFEVRLPLHRIDIRERGLHVRPLEDRDRAPVRALYTRHAASHTGNLDRIDINWDRIERPPPSRTEPARAFVIEEAPGGPIIGYIYLTQVIVEGGKHEVHVQDMGAATPAAARRLWGFLASYATVGTDMVWHAGPSHPMLMLLAEQPYRLAIRHHWMNRIVHVEQALAARGYPVGLTATLSFAVRDATLPENSGVYTLHLAGGHAETVERTPLPTGPTPSGIEADACGLACLYSGIASASTLRQVGMLAGDDRSIALADAAFAGPTPWMTDMF